MARRKKTRKRKTKKTNNRLLKKFESSLNTLLKEVKVLMLSLHARIAVKCVVLSTPVVNRVKDYFNNKFVRPSVRFVKRIKHVAEYLPLLWTDYHWDHGYFTDLMIFKLQKMEETIRNNDLIEEADQVCKSIRVCHKLLSRATNENWHNDLQSKILERTWGQDISWEPAHWKYDKNDKIFSAGSIGKIKLRKWMHVSMPEDVMKNGTYPKYKKEWIKAMRKADNKQQRDLRVALKIIEKDLNSWWD